MTYQEQITKAEKLVSAATELIDSTSSLTDLHRNDERLCQAYVRAGIALSTAYGKLRHLKDELRRVEAKRS